VHYLEKSLVKGMKIRVKVYIPSFVDIKKLDTDSKVELSEGATLAALLHELRVPLPLRLSFLYVVNYEQARWNTPLKDGDTVTFLFPVHGG